MIKRVISGGILGGIVLIACWVVVLGTLPFYEDLALREVPDEVPFYEILKERITEPGRYIVLHDLYDDPEL